MERRVNEELITVSTCLKSIVAYINIKPANVKMNCIELIHKLLSSNEKNFTYENLLIIKNLHKDIVEVSLKKEILTIFAEFYNHIGADLFWKVFSDISNLSNKNIMTLLYHNFPRDDAKTIATSISELSTPECSEKDKEKINIKEKELGKLIRVYKLRT